MLSELAKAEKVVGLKQTKRAIADGTAQNVYIAEDAEMRLRLEISLLCESYNVPVTMVESMKALGGACGIKIGATTAALIK